MRGRPGPLLIGDGSEGAGTGDGTKGYLRGRPGPLFTGVSGVGADFEAVVDCAYVMRAGADLRGRPGGLRNVAAWAEAGAALPALYVFWGGLVGRPDSLLKGDAGERGTADFAGTEADANTSLALRALAGVLRKVILDRELARAS